MQKVVFHLWHCFECCNSEVSQLGINTVHLFLFYSIFQNLSPLPLPRLSRFIRFVFFPQIVLGLLSHSFTSAASFLLWFHFPFFFFYIPLRLNSILGWKRELAGLLSVLFDVQIAQFCAATDRPVLVFLAVPGKGFIFSQNSANLWRAADICLGIIWSKRRFTWRGTIITNSLAASVSGKHADRFDTETPAQFTYSACLSFLLTSSVSVTWWCCSTRVHLQGSSDWQGP